MKHSKTAFLILILALFSSVAFAAPKGSGPGGAGGGKREAPGSRGGATSAGKKSPSFSNNSGAKATPAPKNSGNGGSKKDKPSSPAPSSSVKKEPSPSQSSGGEGKNEPAPKNFAPPVPHMAVSDSEKSVASQDFNADSSIIYYRGSRILLDDNEFALQNVKTERVNASTVNLEITFNQSVNPRTFTADSILVDGEALSSKTKFSFNKKGDTIKIAVPVQSEQFSLMIKDVESFDGTVIEPVTVEFKK